MDWQPSPPTTLDEMYRDLLRLADALVDQRPAAYTAAVISDASADVNIRGKFESKVVWDSTNSRVLYASGGAATDAWVKADGTSTITPS